MTYLEQKARTQLSDRLDSLAVRLRRIHNSGFAVVNPHADRLLSTTDSRTEASFTCWCGAVIEPLIWRGLNHSSSYDSIAREQLNQYLGLPTEDGGFQKWADSHPEYWGNTKGGLVCTVYEHHAFNVPQADLNLLVIATHLAEVSLRVGASNG